ncbi:MAG: glycosyl transferase, partial [Litorimonas sp.]
TRAYLWKRHFAFGQTPTREAADRGVRGVPGVAKWTAVGAVQAVRHGASYLLYSLTGRPARIEHFGRLAQGLGKMFWWDRLSPRLYGSKAR